MTPPAESSSSSRFGWPLDRRTAFFDDVRTGSEPTFRVRFTGAVRDLPILNVPIELPKYRLINGRTASAQQEYVAKNPTVGKDFFRKDPELIHVQEVQHRLLSDLIKTAGLKNKFDDPANKQIDPLILDENGFVINGNRRLCAWRNLIHEDQTKWGHFSHIDVAVLPHADDKEIDRLEGKLQVEKDIRADYTWDARANMMLQRRTQHGLSDDDLAELYDMKLSEIKQLFDMRDYADEYLTSRGKAGLWSEVSDHEEAFRKIVQKRQAGLSLGEKELFKEAAFVLIDNPDEVGGRLYDAIPNLHKFMGPVRKELLQAFPISAPSTSENIFGGGLAPGHDMALAAQIRKSSNGVKAREVIREALHNQKGLERDAESSAYLLKLLTRANGQLETAVASALRPESAKEGVEGQLRQIESKLKWIRDWLNA